MGLGEGRAQTNRSTAMIQGLVQLPVLHEHLTQVALRLGKIGVKLHGLPEMSQSSGCVSLEPQGVAEVVARQGEIGT